MLQCFKRCLKRREKINDRDEIEIGIAGTGLIGGSLCLALSPRHKIAAYDPDLKSLEQICERSGAVPCKALSDLACCKIIFVSVPVERTLATVENLVSLTNGNAVITDTASVKGLLSGLKGRIVGGHPMAGTEKSGAAAAKEGLFENAFYALVRYPCTLERDYKFVESLVREIRALPVEYTAEEHDRAVAYTSHLPHLTAYALIASAAADFSLAGTGLADSTRIASSSAALWTEIFRLNRANVLRAAEEFSELFEKFKDCLKNENYNALTTLITRSKEMRDKLSEEKLNGRGFALEIEVPDRVGAISAVSGRLAAENVNLVNIGILDSREDARGSLRLIFDTERDRDKASRLLKDFNKAL